MKEINKRSLFCEDPFGGVAVMAEIAVDDDGKAVYVYGEWTDEGGELWMTATEESIFDINERIAACGDDVATLDALCEKRDRLAGSQPADAVTAYCKQYQGTIRQMLRDELRAHGIKKRI